MINKKWIEIINGIDFSKTFIYDDLSKREISYEIYFSECLEIANYIEKNINSDAIIVLMDNSYGLSQLYFSIMLTSKYIISIDPYKGDEEIKKILSEIKNTPIITDNKYSKRFDSNQIINSLFDKITYNYRKQIDIKRIVIDKLRHRDDDAIYLITYTSGTSGITKGVKHTLSNLFNSALSLNRNALIKENSRILHVMPMTYMAGILNTLICPFLSKSSIIITERFSISSARYFWDKVIQYNADLFWLSPTMLSIINRLDCNSIGANYCKTHNTHFIIATAALSEKIRDEFNQRYGVTIFASYGLSETLFISVENKYTLKKSRGGSVGKLLDEVECDIMDDNEIKIRVPWMFLGYTNENKNIYFDNSFYKTGDLGEIKQNQLYILGRRKDLIIKGGMKLSPTTIETIISKNKNVSECTVIGIPDNNGDERICCVYTTTNIGNHSILEATIRKEVIDKLGILYRIDYFWCVEELPRNINGKIDKRQLRNLWCKQVK